LIFLQVQVDLVMANPPYLAASFFEKVAAAGPSEKLGSLEDGLGKMKSRVEKMR
jgi:hypothetical protein